MDLERMRALLAALQEARYAGVRSVSYDGKQIAMVQGNGNVYRIVVMDRSLGDQVRRCGSC